MRVSETDVALLIKKTEMLVPNSTDAYGREVVFRPCCLIGNSELNIIIFLDILGPKQNLFSLTVCKLDQYLKNYSEKTVFIP